MATMGDIREDPTDRQQEEFAAVQVIGEVDVEEFAGLEHKLSPQEKIQMIAGVAADKGKRFVVLTNERLLAFNTGTVMRLGDRNQYTDIKIDSIQDMKVENRKGFDTLQLETADKNERLMVPEDEGVTLAGAIRDLQETPDTAQQLEALAEQRDRGHITDEEFERKKKTLLDE